MIAYASVYGNTENAAEHPRLAAARARRDARAMFDVSVTPASDIIAAAFQCSHLVFAATTYNARHLRHDGGRCCTTLPAHNLQKRTVALMENGSWAPVSARHDGGDPRSGCKNMTVLEQSVAIRSSLTEGQLAEIEALADVLAEGIR